MTQVDERLAKVGQNLKKFISESKYKTQVSFAMDGMSQDPSVIRRWIKHGVNSLSTIMYIAEVLEIDFMELLNKELLFFMLKFGSGTLIYIYIYILQLNKGALSVIIVQIASYEGLQFQTKMEV